MVRNYAFPQTFIVLLNIALVMKTKIVKSTQAGLCLKILCCCGQEATKTYVENIKTEFEKKVSEHVQNSTLTHNGCGCNLSQGVTKG